MIDYKSDLAKQNALAVGNTFKLVLKMELAEAHPLTSASSTMKEYIDNEGFKTAMDQLQTLTINKPEYDTVYKAADDVIKSLDNVSLLTRFNDNMLDDVIKVAYVLSWVDLRVKTGYWPKELSKITPEGPLYNAVVDEMRSLVYDSVLSFTRSLKMTENDLLELNPVYTDEKGKQASFDFILNNTVYLATTTQDIKTNSKKNEARLRNFLNNIPDELKDFDITNGVIYYVRHAGKVEQVE